jgi:hypothetical protein
MKRTQKAERLKHMQSWRASGLSRPEYSRQHGLKYSTFLSWFKQELPRPKVGKFIALPASPSMSSLVTISFPNGIRLEYTGKLDQGLIQYLQNA